MKRVVHILQGCVGAFALALLTSASVYGVPATGDNYRIGTGDLLRISVFGYADMTADVRVDEAGTVRYALIGALPVQGVTARTFEATLAQRLNDGGFIRSPQVSVLVLEYRSQQAAVMGQVAKPGRYSLTRPTTVLDLLAEAGGTLGATASDEATLLHVDGGKQLLDLFALFEGDAAQNVPVRAGDTLFVPRAAQFYISGKVQRPGAYRLERNMTVSQAISAGGGLMPTGTERRATVKRHDAQGREKRIGVKGSDLLQPDDVLSIKESLF
jgi:polysaccharide export outer membrane protein